MTHHPLSGDQQQLLAHHRELLFEAEQKVLKEKINDQLDMIDLTDDGVDYHVTETDVRDMLAFMDDYLSRQLGYRRCHECTRLPQIDEQDPRQHADRCFAGRLLRVRQGMRVEA